MSVRLDEHRQLLADRKRIDALSRAIAQIVSSRTGRPGCGIRYWNPGPSRMPRRSLPCLLHRTVRDHRSGARSGARKRIRRTDAFRQGALVVGRNTRIHRRHRLRPDWPFRIRGRHRRDDRRCPIPVSEAGRTNHAGVVTLHVAPIELPTLRNELTVLGDPVGRTRPVARGQDCR